MFTKIKTALLSLIHPFIARLYEMSIETQVVAAAETAEADAAALFHDAITDVKETLEKAEALIVPAAAAAVAAAPVVVAAAPAAQASAAPTIADVAATITKVKDLLVIAERLPTSFDALAALAMKEPTVEAVGAKLKAYLAYAKADAADVFDEVLAAAKAL